MIQFHFNPSANPNKVALMLEETGLAYEVVPVDVTRGGQFTAEFLALNPNAKIPVIEDGEETVFDSNAILLYLAEKTGLFLPADGGRRAELLSWLMFVASGFGPFFGQSVHFRHFAPPNDYALQRYTFEARRHATVVDGRLAAHRYMVGGSYGIVDMAVWGWARMIPFVLGEDGWDGVPNLKRLVDEIGERPAAKAVDALARKHAFNEVMDEQARRHIFRHQFA